MSVREFVTKNPAADYRAITARFGTPVQVAQSYIAQMETNELLDAMRVRQKVLVIALVAAAALVMIDFGFEVTAYLKYSSEMNGFAVVEIIELEDIPLEEGE